MQSPGQEHTTGWDSGGAHMGTVLHMCMPSWARNEVICQSQLPQCITHDVCAISAQARSRASTWAILPKQLSCKVVETTQSAYQPDLLIRCQ